MTYILTRIAFQSKQNSTPQPLPPSWKSSSSFFAVSNVRVLQSKITKIKGLISVKILLLQLFSLQFAMARGQTDLALCSAWFGIPIGTIPAIAWSLPEVHIYICKKYIQFRTQRTVIIRILFIGKLQNVLFLRGVTL